MEFDLGGEKYVATPENSLLVAHAAGKTALNGVEMSNKRFDHIAARYEDSWLFLWREQMDGFGEIAQYMVNNEYQATLNKRKVGDVALQAYDSYLTQMAKKHMGDLDKGLEELLGNN